MDFKPGDEVVCVDAQHTHLPVVCPELSEGAVYRVSDVWIDNSVRGREVNVGLVGVEANTTTGGFWAGRFRKVHRRDLSAWLKTEVKNTDHIDKRVKEKA